MTRIQLNATVQESKPEAEAAAGEEFEFVIGDREFHVRKPTIDELMFLQTGTYGRPMVTAMMTVFDFLETLMEPREFLALRRLYGKGVITTGLLIGGDDQNEQGIVDILIESVTARPLDQSSDSSTSEPSTGKRSTGRSPGAGSIQAD